MHYSRIILSRFTIKAPLSNKKAPEGACLMKLAEGQGFEPWSPGSPVKRFSRPPHSAALPPFRSCRSSSERQVLNVIKRSGPWVKWKQRRPPRRRTALFFPSFPCCSRGSFRFHKNLIPFFYIFLAFSNTGDILYGMTIFDRIRILREKKHISDPPRIS